MNKEDTYTEVLHFAYLYVILFLLAMTLIIISKEMNKQELPASDNIINQKNHNKND